MQALAGDKVQLANLSNARDTQTMIRLLQSGEKELDVLDAGTTMRFLTAFCTATSRETVLTGTARMQQRPVKILVEALRGLGADINYLKNEGYPPIHIKNFKQQARKASVPGNVSSQYISALLMVAPSLPLGLELQLTGKIYSRPYIDMTLQLMQHFGIRYSEQQNTISIEPQPWQGGNYTVESDWSGASYWYAVTALATEAEIELKGLRRDSFQGDSKIAEIGEMLGVATRYTAQGVVLTKKAHQQKFLYNFAHCPDLAQTVAVICAAKGIEAELLGLESLRIKETDRIAALQQELRKTGVQAVAEGDKKLLLNGKAEVRPGTVFDTYEDHRMAMAFAPLALLAPVIVSEPGVVAKSYPSYWQDLQLAGFTLE